MPLFNELMSLISGPRPVPVPLQPEGQEQKLQICDQAKTIFPLTRSQRGMWNDYQTDSQSAKYNLTLEWDLLKVSTEHSSKPEHAFSISQLIQVVNSLTERHGVLRSVIRNISHEPHHVEYAPGSVTPQVRVLQKELGVFSEVTVSETLYQPIYLEKELPVRWVILQDAEVYRMYAVGHHIAVDGHAMSILSREFLAQLLNSDPALERLSVDFNQMHMLERAWAHSSSYATSQKVLLSQVENKYDGPWIPRTSTRSVGSASQGAGTSPYRQIDAWASIPKTELAEWSNVYKTSWFRVATTMAGLMVADRTRPPLGYELALSVGFGSRPAVMSNCVGQFANALPVKVPLWEVLHRGDGSLRSLVSATAKNLSAVKKNEMFPAVDIGKAVRDKMHSSYEPPRVAVTYSPKLASTACRLFPVNGMWDLFICFLEGDDDVKLGVIYNPDVFSATDIGEMKSVWNSFMSAAKQENVVLRDLLLWLPRYPSLPTRRPASQLEASPPRLVHCWFDAHAQTNPNAEALACSESGSVMTYGELYASTEKKARYLVQQGIRTDDRVVIHLPRGFAILEWALAILKAGAAFVYLDTTLPETQKQYILSNCQPELVVDDDLVSNMPTISTGDAADLENTKKAAATDLAYMIYTSGSTGQPKGVMVEHASLSRFVETATSVYATGFGSRILQLATFSFDASILEWTTALCTGGCLCFAENPKLLVGEYLADVIEENRVSFMQITPSALETLPTNRSLSSLRMVSIGGEAPTRDILSRWHHRVDLVNAYGPTEGAVAVAFNRMDKSCTLPDSITVGRPNPDTEFYICGPDFGPVIGPDRVGEICISGPQVARGYCQLPEKTAEAFAIHPTQDKRLYRTGDKGKMLENGELMVMGRADRQLKLRGFRLQPEEIEGAILATQAGVAESSVFLSEDGANLIAAISPERVSDAQLLQELRRELPDFKVPNTFVHLDQLSKNSSGKIDHKATRMNALATLNAQFLATATDSDSEEDSALSEQEEDLGTTVAEQVSDIWAQVLNRQHRPQSNVNFFDIGGHSLLVPKLHSKLQAAFPHMSIRLVDLFHQSTIEQQVALCGSKSSRGASRIMGARMGTKRAKRRPTTKNGSSPTFGSGSSTPATSIDGGDIDQGDQDGIAIVGLAGRFPGADNPDEFYANLMRGYSGITESDPGSEKRQTLEGNLWVPRAGVLSSVEDFDHDFWNLSSEEATEMDPQQRLFLEVADEALCNAGIDFKTTDGQAQLGARAGLFVGSANNSYHLHTESVASDPFLKENRGFVAPSISARTAYHLNICGPSVTIQTNCASSTVALSLAFDSLRLGRCDVAVVGGVSVQLFEGGYVTQEGQIFSAQGVCRPFDAKADGTVPADAVTAVVLRRYSAAVRQQKPMYARIRGTAIGSDGAMEKAGYQVPSPRGQAEVIKAAWTVAGTDPETLSYAEVHGSGTPIGDALELQGLATAFKDLSKGKEHAFTVGSTKGNIGNAQHSSGLVSLIKICKSMQAGVVPPILGLDVKNAMIDPGLKLRLAQQPTKLERNSTLAVSASGWGGVNSHLVLAFPPEGLQRAPGKQVERSFDRKTLAAPRLRSTVFGGDGKPGGQDTQDMRDRFVDVIRSHASHLLGTAVEQDTDLRGLGLDSKAYVQLSSSVSKDLNDINIGVSGYLLPVLTPTTLAVLFVNQVGNTQHLEHTITELPTCNLNLLTNPVGAQQAVVLLPGSGGSLASAAPLLTALKSCLAEAKVSLATIEHPGVDGTLDHVPNYVQSVLAKLSHTKKIFLVGVSLGGLHTVNTMQGLLDTMGHETCPEVMIALLDSPPPQNVPKKPFSGTQALYIGAKNGLYGNNDSTKVWREVLPEVRFAEVECGHHELWGERGGEETASLLAKLVLTDIIAQ